MPFPAMTHQMQIQTQLRNSAVQSLINADNKQTLQTGNYLLRPGVSQVHFPCTWYHIHYLCSARAHAVMLYGHTTEHCVMGACRWSPWVYQWLRACQVWTQQTGRERLQVNNRKKKKFELGSRSNQTTQCEINNMHIIFWCILCQCLVFNNVHRIRTETQTKEENAT